MMKRKTLLGLWMLLVASYVDAQSVRDSSLAMTNINFHLGYQSPAGDLALRFGSNATVGGGVSYKTVSNWIFGVESVFMFGESVKQPVALELTTSQGFVIDQLGQPTELLVLERGFMVHATAGRLFDFLGPNPNSGLLVKLGAGVLQHKILLETRNNDVPPLEGEYLKGYDRLTNGFSTYGFVGYKLMSNRRLVNLTLGLETVQAFTESRRDFNFDLGRRDDRKRNDSLYGLRLIWTFPIYRRQAAGFYY